MSTKRAYVYNNARAPKPLMAVECDTVTRGLAKVSAHVNLGSLKPGMVFRLVKGREPDMQSSRVIERVDQKETGQSTISFVAPKADAVAPKT